MKKVLFLLFLMTIQIFSLHSFVEDVIKFANTVSENIGKLTKDIAGLVSDTKQLYGSARKSFNDITSSIDRIKSGREVFEKIDQALEIIEKQFDLINSLVNILYSASETVKSSSNLIQPFFKDVSRQGVDIANKMESIASIILNSGVKAQEIIRPLRTAMQQITSALALLNREISPDLKKSLSLTESVILEQAQEAEKKFEKELEEWVMIPK